MSVQQPLGAETPLERFFAKYPNFQVQHSNSPVVEFDRLCKLHHWKKGGPEREIARKAFHIAMKKEFDNLYGSDEHDIKTRYAMAQLTHTTNQRSNPRFVLPSFLNLLSDVLLTLGSQFLWKQKAPTRSEKY
jgi:hypothetical protein